MFDRTSHLRALSADPAIVAKRAAAMRVQWTGDMDAALIDMAMRRIGIIPIARRIGVSKAVARKRRDDLGLPKGRPPGPSPRVRGQIICRIIE